MIVLVWRRAAALLPVVALLVASLTPASPARAGGGEQLLIVTINLNEAWGADLKDSSEVGAFVTALLRAAPAYPDVVLLQEVRRAPVLKAARILTRKTGQQYVSPLRLREEPWRFTANGTWIESDTAILLNSATMSARGDGGGVKTPDPWNEKYDRAKKEHAHLVVKHRSTDTQIGLVTLHFGAPPVRSDANAKLIASWARKVAAFQENKHTGMLQVMGGDFNWPKRIAERVQPFWNVLEGEHGYIEGITPFTSGPENPAVDYIFTTTAARSGGAGPKGSYSNHRFFWTVLGL